MKRRLAAAITIIAGVSLLAFASPRTVRQAALEIEVEAKNPWTHLGLNNLPENFQFAIVTDRTGGHRPGIFEAAVAKLNLMQPQFVMSVGDLIEGKHGDPVITRAQWSEFNSFVRSLEMPFFYVPGNHDLQEASAIPLWQEQFGRTYFHFVYHNVLFLALNSEDPPAYEVDGVKTGRLGDEQLAWIGRVLDANQGVRWTVAFIHKPMWQHGERTNWNDVEKLFGDRPRTVFAGHNHRYRTDVVNGHTYYALATTGGSSKMQGVAAGEFDHVMWVTMTRQGPRLANLMLDGIWTDDPVAETLDRPAALGTPLAPGANGQPRGKAKRAASAAAP